MRRLIEGRAEDAVLEPSGDGLDGLVKTLQARDLVELNTQDPVRLHAPRLEEMLDHLLEEGCLADLSRAS